MTFKIHDKLNRIVAVSVNLQETGAEINRLTEKLKADEKELDLLTVHYMQTEMEYGKLIGEDIDHLPTIEALLQKHGEAKPKKAVSANRQTFFLVKRSDGRYWGGSNWKWTLSRENSYGFPDEERAWSFINNNFDKPDPDWDPNKRYKTVPHAEYDAEGRAIPIENPNEEF
jgi:hypothetical protein